MVDDENSILGKAKARREALKVGDQQLSLSTEQIFKDNVFPKLRKIEEEFLSSIPPIFFPLIEEVKQYIENKENRKLTLFQHTTFTGFNFGEFSLESVQQVHKGKQREWLVEFFEKGQPQHIKMKTVVSLYADDRNIPNLIQKFDYDGRLSSTLGGKDPYTRNEAKNNSQEELNRFIERIQAALKSGDYK